MLFACWMQVTPERYMQAIAALQPDMYVALADEVSCYTCSTSSDPTAAAAVAAVVAAAAAQSAR
jgi:hypothetical protein